MRVMFFHAGLVGFCLAGVSSCAARTADPGLGEQGALALDDRESCSAARERCRAKGWKYAAFFVEFHCRVKDVWRCDRSGDVAPAQRSLFEIAVAHDGTLRKLRLVHGSGNADRDAAAASAIQRASPFAAPPPQMLNREKVAVFKSAPRCGGG
jgi:TonB family protein